MSRKRPPKNFLMLDEDVVPQVDPASGELIPVPGPPNPDDPDGIPETPHEIDFPGDPTPLGQEPGEAAPPPAPPVSVAAPALLPQAHFPSDVHYEARITIVDAWQYPGFLKSAPEWVDRNWVGFADYDELRGVEAGPCLRVPNATGTVTIARVGDYVARQEVKITKDFSDIRIEVWGRDQFEKLFYPVDSRSIEGIANPRNARQPEFESG